MLANVLTYVIYVYWKQSEFAVLGPDITKKWSTMQHNVFKLSFTALYVSSMLTHQVTSLQSWNNDANVVKIV